MFRLSASTFTLCSLLAILSTTNAEKETNVLTEKSLLPDIAAKGNLLESARTFGSGNGGVRYIISTLSSSNNQPPGMFMYGQQQPTTTSSTTPSTTTTSTTTTTTTTPPPTTTTTTMASQTMSSTAATTTTSTTPAPPLPPVLLGSQCKANSDCAGIANSRCFNGLCDCSTTTVALANLACISVANAFGDKCIITAQCKGLDPLAACYLDRCMCESIYYVADMSCPASGGGSTDYYLPTSNTGGSTTIQCLRKQHLGAACCGDRQCSYEVWNSKCTNNQCQCGAGFVNIGTHACAPKATAMGGNCSVNAQCMDLPGTSCDSTGKCTCDAQAQFVTGMIIPTSPTGGATDRRKRQAMTPMTSAMSMTSSAMGMASVMCLPTVRLGAMCMTNEQCSTRTPNSICSMSVCTCGGGFFPDMANSTCQKKNIKFQKPYYEFAVGCCGGENATNTRFVGQVCPDPVRTNLPGPFTFSTSDPDFTIDSFGGITTSTFLAAPTNLSVTVSSGTRSDITSVLLIPDPCCNIAPTATVSSVTVTINAMFAGLCLFMQDVAQFAYNADYLFNLNDLFSEPCGERPAIGTPTIMSTGFLAPNTVVTGPAAFAGTPFAGPFNIASSSCLVTNNVLQFTGGIAAGSTAMCVTVLPATGCNGISASSTVTFNLFCPT